MITNEALMKEEQFHNDWAAMVNIEDVMVDEFFEASTSPENRWILNKLGDLSGKRILELGCGNGEASVYFAKKGADVTASDISEGMLDLAKKVAEKHGVSFKTLKCSTDNIISPDNSFDIVFAANVLHHTNVRAALSEAHRVLKKGGIFASWDPLAHNPIINIYRKIASCVRTEDERPLRMKDLKLFQGIFEKVEYHTTWLFTLWIFLNFYLQGVSPNKERYWKKILVDHTRLAPTFLKLEKIDNMFLKLMPFLRRYCWNLVVVAIK